MVITCFSRMERRLTGPSTSEPSWISSCQAVGLAAPQKGTERLWNGNPSPETWHPKIFNFWRYVNGKVYVPPLPQTIDELKIRIRAAIQTVTIAVLIKVWANMNRRLQQVIWTKDWHIENIKVQTLSKYIHIFNQRACISKTNAQLKIQIFVFLCFTLSFSCCIY